MDRRLQHLTLGSAFRALTDLAFPRLCTACGRPLLPCEDDLCCCCEADLPRTHFELLTHNPMADRFNALVEAHRYCYATALFYYSGPYKQITQALKYRRNFGVGRRFARELASTLPEWMRDVDAVVPVPLHRTRRWQRGYNQAEVIARTVAASLREMQKPSPERPSSALASEPQSPEISGYLIQARFLPLLKRSRRTKSQAHLGMGEKSLNVKGAFRVRRHFTNRLRSLKDTATGIVPGTTSSPAPHHILLIDDVFTTGATLAACHSALLEAYGDSIRISVATLAFVGRA